MKGRIVLLIVLLVLIAGVSIANAGGMPGAVGGAPAGAPMDHTLHMITLVLFSMAKTIRFMIVVWKRRRRCHAFYRLIVATCGALMWIAGLMLSEMTLELTGMIVVCLSHCTECFLHAIDEVRRDLDHDDDARRTTDAGETESRRES